MASAMANTCSTVSTGRGVLLAGSTDPARIASQEPVVGRGVEDRVQQPVRLGDAGLPHPGVAPFLVPAADVRLRDRADRKLAERREQMQSQGVLVPLACRLRDVALVDPPRRELGDGTRRRSGSSQSPRISSALLGRQPVGGVALAFQGVRRRGIDTVGTGIAHLPPAGGQLPDAPEVPLAAGHQPARLRTVAGTRPRSIRPSTTEPAMRTLRPIRMNSIRRSSMSRRTYRSLVFSRSATCGASHDLREPSGRRGSASRSPARRGVATDQAREIVTRHGSLGR